MNKDRSAKTGNKCNDAKFYYNRKLYKLEFYSVSASVLDKSEDVKYQDSLSQYDYIPTNKPETVEKDAVFAGWYQNPECTGERYDLASHTMPSNNIALYAKWVNGLYTVTTYTDETMKELYTYDGYSGVQRDIEKYTLAKEPMAPKKDGYVFVGWFYKDGDAEKLFSFTMTITRDYNLYPKFSEPMYLAYTVHYYIEGTETPVADDSTRTALVGTTVTEKAKMGSELNLVPSDMQSKYFPNNTSTSVKIDKEGIEIIFYYKEATKVKYTVYYQDENGKNLHEPVQRETDLSVVTEKYIHIDNYWPIQNEIELALSVNEESNIIIFVYKPMFSTLTIQKSGSEDIDENQTFIFNIKGADENTKNIDLTVTVHGNSQTTVCELPVGAYTVEEVTSWSWRYTPDENKKTVNVVAGGSSVSFKNDRTEDKWLNGDNYSVNIFK